MTVTPSIRAFTGAGSADQQRLAGIVFTPDCNGGVDTRYFVEFINHVFTVYDKSTGNVVERTSGSDFWSRAGLSRPGNIVDPRIVFIPDAGRHGQWLAVQLELGNYVYIATTSPNDPMADPRLGHWKAASFDIRGNDFTQLGYDADGIYIGLDVADEASQGRSPMIVQIPRASALAWPPQVGADAIKVMGPLDKRKFGDCLYPVMDTSGVGWPYETAIGIDNTTKRHLTCSLISPKFREILSYAQIEVPPFDPIVGYYRVRQPSGSVIVPWYNADIVSPPMGDGFNIWLTQTVQKMGSLAVRWYRLAIDPLTRQPGLAAWGEIFQDNYDHFNPSIVSFGRDDYTLISLSRSGGSGTPTDPNNPLCGNLGAYVAVVRESESGQPPVYAVRSGKVADYVPQNQNRWGDYSTICRDPVNPRRAWTVNQYALQGGASSQWCNVFASIDVPAP